MGHGAVLPPSARAVKGSVNRRMPAGCGTLAVDLRHLAGMLGRTSNLARIGGRVAEPARESGPALAAARTEVRGRTPKKSTPKTAVRRAQILDAVFAVIAERGTAGASITEIAEQAGIARGALHYFFESKDEITSSLMQRLGARYLDELDGYLEGRRRRAHALVPSFVHYHFAGDPHAAHARIGVWIGFWGQAAASSSIRAVVADIQTEARERAIAAIDHDVPGAAHLTPIERTGIASALLSLVEGGILQWRIAGGAAGTLHRETLREAAQLAAAGLLRALPSAHRMVA